MRLIRPGGTKGRKRLAGALAGVLLLVLAGMFAVSGYVAAKLTSVPTEAVTGSPSQHGLRYENVKFPAREDSVRLAAWYIHPGRSVPKCSVIMVHGKDHHRNDRNIQMMEVAADLARHGYSVLMPDLRAHGESEGERFSLGYYERRDVLGAIDYLSKRPDASHCIAGLGFSTGAVALISAAAEDRRIRAVIADSAWPDTHLILDRELPGESGLPPVFTPITMFMARTMYGMDLNSLRPMDSIDEIAPRPVFLIYGGQDKHIRPDEAGMLYAAAKDPKAELWVNQGSRHVRSYADHPKEYIERVTEFLDRSVRAR